MKKSEFYLLAGSFLRLLRYIVQILLQILFIIPGLCILVIAFVFRAIELIFHFASNSLASAVGWIIQYVFR